VDGKTYALAQGAVSIGGYTAGGDAGGGVTKNHPTVGRISGGATIEREIPLSIMNKQELIIMIDNPDFNTVTRVADAINTRMEESLATPIDSGTLKLKIPARLQGKVVNLIARIGDLRVTPDNIAKIIVNEKTGTVVIGQNVSIQEVAVAHGNLSIQIKETKEVSQPLPFSPAGLGAGPKEVGGGIIAAPGGSTIVTPDSDVRVAEEKNQLILIPPGNTIGELVKGLNAIGVTPRDLITILQVLKAAGALHGELEII
jgi:flagellar P-ring protein precursor FlgI